MGTNYNPYRGKDGRFQSGPRKVYPAQSDEWEDVAKINEDLKNTQINSSQTQKDKLNKEEKNRDKIKAIQKELEKWTEIQKKPYQSPYLIKKATVEIQKLRLKLSKLQNGQSKE